MKDFIGPPGRVNMQLSEIPLCKMYPVNDERELVGGEGKEEADVAMLQNIRIFFFSVIFLARFSLATCH